MVKHIPVFALKTVLEFRDCSLWPESDCVLTADPLNVASVGWYQEQADVDGLSKVGAGSGFLRVLVQGVVSSSGAGDM